MNIKPLWIPIVFGLMICSSCFNEITEDTINYSRVSDKIVNSHIDASSSTFLFQMKSSFNAELAESLLSIDNIVSVARVFPDVSGEEESAAAFGLDKWYEVMIEDDADITDIAYRVSLEDFVDKVQYNTIVTESNASVHSSEEKNHCA